MVTSQMGTTAVGENGCQVFFVYWYIMNHLTEEKGGFCKIVSQKGFVFFIPKMKL